MTDRDERSESSRRDFIKRVSIGAAFATPIVTSFSMGGLNTAGALGGGANASNASDSIN